MNWRKWLGRNKAGVSVPVAKALGKVLGVEWPVFFDDEGEDRKEG